MFDILLAAKYTEYMILGYALAAGILMVLVGSIWWRYQMLSKDEALLEQLEQEEQRETAPSP